MADFSKINEQVNNNLEAQAPTPAPVPAAPPAVTPGYQAQLAEANAKIARLESERAVEKAETERRLSDQRIKTLAAAAHKPAASLDSGRDAVARSKAIAAVGGNALWYRQSADDRCAALGVTDSASVQDSTIKKLFGPTSDSLAAQELAFSNPEEYKRLKKIAIERR